MSEAEARVSRENDELSAERMARQNDPAKDARTWLLNSSVGTLSTLAAKPDLLGYPMGSVVPFALDRHGRPVIYTATIAAHTANLRRDPRASLFIRQADVKGDPQAAWRLSVVGDFRRLTANSDDQDGEDVARDELEDIAARYFERIPAAQAYGTTHRFSFWRMSSLKRARYIAGFGKICWLGGDELVRLPEESFRAAAKHAVRHMNDDHIDSMRQMCRGFYGFEPESVCMVELDTTGFALVADARRLHFSFAGEVEIDDLRSTIIQVLGDAKKRMVAQ